MRKAFNWYAYLPYLLLLIYLTNGVLLIPRISITNDEESHFNYGLRVLKGHPEKVIYDDGSLMPISALNVLPRAGEQLINPSLKKTDWGKTDITHGRYVTLIICLFIGLFIYWWAKQLYGEKAGLVGLFLFTFCPNLNAHATLVTTDAYAALFTISTLYFLWRLLKTESWVDLLCFSISIGIAQLAKQSLVHLLIICPLFTCFYWLNNGSFFNNIGRKVLRWLLCVSIILIIINIGFLFNHTGETLNNYIFKSTFFNKFQSSFSVVGNIPIPVPAPFVAGLDLTKAMEEIGPGHPDEAGSNNYLLGEQRSGPFWYYYFVILLVKLPIPTLIAICILGLFTLFNLKKLSIFKTGNPIVFSLVYLLLFFCFFVNFEPGIRHILILLPLTYVLLGKLATFNYNVFYAKAIAFIAIVYYIVTFYCYYPNLIAYTNELIWNKNKAYKIMADSNLDFGQGGYWLQDYLMKNPEIKIPSSKPEAGKFILGINAYLDLDQRHTHAWLSNNFEPVKHFNHCYLIFDISEAALREKHLIK
jgi:hypothetical protein